MNYKIELTVGDECGDGHDKRESYYYTSNYLRKDIEKAYKESVKLTGIDFIEVVACDYEDCFINRSIYDKLVEAGVNNLLNDSDEWEQPDDEDGSEINHYLDIDTYINLYIEFVKISLPDLVMEQTCLDYDSIHIGGYGLFY